MGGEIIMRKVFAIIKRKALSIILVVILSLVVFNSIKIAGIESDIGYIRQALTGHGLFWGGEGIKGDIAIVIILRLSTKLRIIHSN